MHRRQFIKVTAGVLGSTALPSMAAINAANRPNLTSVSPLTALPMNQTRHWLSEDFWGNRLQDWRVHNGALECLQGDKSFEVRTVSLLTRSLLNIQKPARIQAVFQNLTLDKSGFCGFLLGAGKDELDYRGAALVQRAAGVNGGFMAVMNEQGELSFRDFSNQEKPLGFEKLTRTANETNGKVRQSPILLDCHIDPTSENTFDVRLIASDLNSGKELGFVVRTNVPANELIGGISLISSPNANQNGTRWKISNVATGGDKISVNPERGLGEVMGCLHSVNKNILKLTAQFMPIDLSLHATARLDYKLTNASNWTKGPLAKIEDGYVALFRLDNWQYQHSFDYRIVYSNDDKTTLYSGQIVSDPQTGKSLKIALFSCIIPTSKSLDQEHYQKHIPQERELGRYSKENVLFPHNQLVSNSDKHQPDLYIFCGDQYYETFPTRYGRETKDAKLDTLYRWYLWYWTFRDSVKSRPSIILADDHDILQGNLWGNGGKDPDIVKEEHGGYSWDKDLVRMVYRIQHGHNPDAYDPTPILHDIPVTYGHFVYGGVSFAIIEDRKFKSPPIYEGDPTKITGELLGARQEKFLADWKNIDADLPKICITASMWGSPQTKENQIPLLDYDANGYPFDGRTRAVKLVSDANALVLAGDQHLGMVAQQSIDSFDDGTVFFSGPAAAAFWQRWFEGNNKLENQYKNNPNSGNFIDSFGNKMRVLAVANPKITYPEFAASNTSWGMFLADNSIKTEGYGIVEVNHEKQAYNLECWSWDANPKTDKQFDGWPVSVSFKGKLI